jgi:hypothetical protein
MVVHSILLRNAFNAERSVHVGLESVRSLKGYELSGGLSSNLKTKPVRSVNDHTGVAHFPDNSLGIDSDQRCGSNLATGRRTYRDY